MPYPYHKITQEDIRDIIEATSADRVACGEEIPKEYYHDEMPEYGIYMPDVYVEALCAEEVSKIMKIAYERNIPVTARGAGTGLSGGATCKFAEFYFLL